MPVSHLGLTVSHIPSATSFYLAALQPLGYRYIGHQGDSIGLGIDSADFFLTQSPIAARISPNHIAFLAESRNVVRECYTAALNSGGHPNGSPNYRNDECTCFNAAVGDLDGNTIEFIFRQPHDQDGCCGSSAPPEGSRVLNWQKDVAESAAQDDAKSVTQSMVSRGSLASRSSRARSRMQTAVDLASTASKSVKSDAPRQGIARTNTAPAKPDFPSKTLIGTALGAAAGAALMFAMTKAESNNAREEAEHLERMASQSRRRHSVDERIPPPPKAETVPPSIPPAAPSRVSRQEDRKFHRNYSVTESAFSRRQPPPTHAMRMIEETGYNNDDDDVQQVMSRYNNLRPKATRSRTQDDYEYAPAARSRSEAPTGYSMKRASTLPVEDVDRPNYYLEAPPPKTTVSKHSSRHDGPSKSSASHVSRHSHRRSSTDDQNLKRHDSGISVHSSRRDRERATETDRRSSASQASTIKPSRRQYEDAANIAAAVPKLAGSRAPSSCYYPAAISLPPSQASSRATAVQDDRSRAKSKAPAAPEEPLVPSKESWEDFTAEESDGLGDIKTVLPDDSISCIDLPKTRHRRKHHHSSSSSKRSEASTVKPIKRDRESEVSLPHRSRKGKDKEVKKGMFDFS